MTLREILSIQHPELIDDIWYGGCANCPSTYGYDTEGNEKCDSKTVNNDICRECWNREYKGEVTKQEQMIIDLRESLKDCTKRIEDLDSEATMLHDELYDIYDYAVDKTGCYFGMHPTSEFIKNSFNKVLNSRDTYKFALIGTYIGIAILLALFMIFGG